uniref:hypothetical protein 38 n=1 Tax=Moniliophthora perniciosa TaxID=153609 RepID=UPI0000242333|nr:hypothetical protein 38 [Moniliophthora perniciosa]AAQ74335.1 hypothetical protein 38 [Moniliophthora perniciosa]
MLNSLRCAASTPPLLSANLLHNELNKGYAVRREWSLFPSLACAAAQVGLLLSFLQRLPSLLVKPKED